MRPLFFQFISDLVPEKDIFSHSVFDLFWPIKSTAIQSDCGLDWPVSLPRKALDILMTYLGNPSALSLSVEVEQQWRLRIVSSALTDSTCPQIVSPQVSRSVFLPFFPVSIVCVLPRRPTDHLFHNQQQQPTTHRGRGVGHHSDPAFGQDSAGRLLPIEAHPPPHHLLATCGPLASLSQPLARNRRTCIGYAEPWVWRRKTKDSRPCAGRLPVVETLQLADRHHN
ncbi:hypothetical protein PCANC_02958 [Puccinia coronata f. sp. avenae]|uniref:Uncharacterized protein n=1 Tax=Puccinia coronata f. sp. avenae TaxID=200324 RepID=A0A2N5T8E2_9BASI|nr:hypothetical protein PCANC_02958 [Puccinia coronata f. sp. avenae]